MTHSIFSQDKDQYIVFFEKYSPAILKNHIINHLKENPNDVLEHCKEYSPGELGRFYGQKIVAMYTTNPKNKKVSRIVLKGDKTYYKSIE